MQLNLGPNSLKKPHIPSIAASPLKNHNIPLHC